MRGGGNLKIIARIEAPQVMARIPAHLQRTVREQYPSERPCAVPASPVPPALP